MGSKPRCAAVLQVQMSRNYRCRPTARIQNTVGMIIWPSSATDSRDCVVCIQSTSQEPINVDGKVIIRRIPKDAYTLTYLMCLHRKQCVVFVCQQIMYEVR